VSLQQKNEIESKHNEKKKKKCNGCAVICFFGPNAHKVLSMQVVPMFGTTVS
jgi:hypothetical protein